MTEEQENILSDLMDMYGNYVITAKDYFNKAINNHKIPYEIVEEYWETSRWRRKKK